MQAAQNAGSLESLSPVSIVTDRKPLAVCLSEHGGKQVDNIRISLDDDNYRQSKPTRLATFPVRSADIDGFEI